MADSDDQKNPDAKPDRNPNTILIAHVTAHLLDGSSFELYPFVDADDVKGKVKELAEGWAKSGFLLRGSRLIPWQQVKLLEATSVEEITRQQAQQRLMNWRADNQLKAVQGFWKTKNAGEDESESDSDSTDDSGDSKGDQDVEGTDK